MLGTILFPAHPAVPQCTQDEGAQWHLCPFAPFPVPQQVMIIDGAGSTAGLADQQCINQLIIDRPPTWLHLLEGSSGAALGTDLKPGMESTSFNQRGEQLFKLYPSG